MKCKICGLDNIDKYDKNYIIKSKRYIHIDCYKEHMLNKGKSIEDIQFEIDCIRNDIESNLVKTKEKDMFLKEIFSNYDISVLPSFFYVKVANITKGTHKGMSRPISYFELNEMFVLMRKYLDNSNARMISKGKGFKTELDRLNYDLAIIINNYDKYLKHKTETKSIEREIKNINKTIKESNNIEIKIKPKQTKESSLIDSIDEFF